METISISNLKAHLSETLKRVRTGSRVVIMDRNIPVAEISPFPQKDEGIAIQRASKKEMEGSLNLKIHLDFDAVDYLLEDRRKGAF